MITIIHAIDKHGILGDGKNTHFSMVNHDDDTTKGYRAGFYALGCELPRYPMPAIKVGVDWVPSYRGGPYVVLFECRKVTNGRWHNTRKDFFKAIDCDTNN